ncbi:cell division protein FtsZ [Candidatus Phycosocius bacilliformis]|uniref:Cell division protein FtsZ n=1 Tax=Candidatus Phycosocius bacilliformis TaxID=1445552 RepID=A0A2P2ECY0_9PROT|nr:cell division protein FtsZ [Candidatus Phycosocius bacilliformis]GBF58910.1 cell division protein FtsZ [Candidatus Phycosocius bacilliformis]
MAIRLNVPPQTELSPRIVVFGVGGAGGNAVNNMIDADLQGVEFVVANTDAQALARSKAERRIQIGLNTTQGLGAGATPQVGMAAAEESQSEILDHLADANMVFITAGMGGGTGTGAAPVIARTAKEQGILTVAVVTRPFQFEGPRRMRMADAGIAELQKYVDTLIIIPNQNLFRVANDKTTFHQAFQLADQVLHSGVRGITDLMVMPGLINLDFADVRSVMGEMGKAMMGTGEASGERRALEAATKAINNPLLEDMSLKGARGVLINITGGYDMTLFELDEAANHIRQEVDPDANIIVGSTFDESLEGVMRVSVVATGIEAAAAMETRPQGASFFSASPAQQPAASSPGPTVVRVNNGREPLVHQPIVQRQQEPQPAPVAAQAVHQQPSYQQPAAMAQPAPEPVAQPVQQPLFQQPVQAAPEPMHARQDYGQQPAQQAQPAYGATARPAYQAAQPRPQMHAPVQRAEPPAYSARPTPPQPQEEARPQRNSGFNGFNIFGRPKPAQREEQWDERPEPTAKSLTQTPPLFGDEFDDEIEIPTFLRKQAN